MRKMLFGIFGFTMIISGFCVVSVIKEASAEVRVEVNIGPPVIMVDEPAEVVYVPDSGVYFVPDGDYEIFFYRGVWWSHRGRHWYRSRYYRNGWGIARAEEVPRSVFRMPVDYRQRFGRERHIRYRDWKERRDQPERGAKHNGNNKDRGGERGKGRQDGNRN